jgi:hypothetical protein
VGTAHDVLYEKTNAALYNEFIISIISLADFIEEDVVFDVDELSEE